MNPIEYEVSGQELSIVQKGGPTRSCSLPWPIAQVLEFAGVLVVRVEPAPGGTFNENVYGILPDGRIAWQVAARKYVYDDSPYTALVRSGDEVKLMNWDGLELLVDPATGRELEERYGK